MGDYFTPICTACDVVADDDVKRAPGGLGNTNVLSVFLIDHIYCGRPKDGTGIMLIPEHKIGEWREKFAAAREAEHPT